jgi:hypothetical protein
MPLRGILGWGLTNKNYHMKQNDTGIEFIPKLRILREFSRIPEFGDSSEFTNPREIGF